MNTFGYVDLAEYLLSIRFEIVATITREAQKERHPPSRRVGQRQLAEHDRMICMAAMRARDAGESIPEHVAVFANAAVESGMTEHGVISPQNYYQYMSKYALTDHQRHILEQIDCPLCRGLWIPGDVHLCECSYEERHETFNKKK